MAARVAATPAILLAGGTASLILFLTHVVRLWPETADDAFITFRYSKMLVLGYGPNFNPPPPHAEGYTTFLWMLIMAVPHAAAMSPVVFAKVVGVLCMICAVVGSGLIVDRFAASLRGRGLGVPTLVPVALSAYFVSTAVHAVAGLETALYTFLITAYFVLLIAYPLGPRRLASRSLGAVALLVGMTRPDGNLVVVVGAAALLLLVGASHRRRLILDLAIFYLLPGLIYFVWRFSYYGHLFPLTYYAKLGHVAGLAGKDYIHSFVDLFRWLIPVAALGLMGKGWKLLLPPTLASLALVCFFVFPAPVTGFDWRFVFPVVPFGFALVGIALARLVAYGNAAPGRRRGAAVAALALAMAFVGFKAVEAIDAGTAGEIAGHRFNAMANHHREAFGRFLAGFQPPTLDHLLSVGDAGAIPYYSRWRALDTYSLNDPHIAITGDHSPGYVLAQRPDLILVTSSSVHRVTDPLARAALRTGMRHIMTLTVVAGVHGEGGYYFWAFARPKSALAAYLGRWNN